MRAPGSQTRFSFAVHREAHVVAVLPGIITCHRFKQWWTCKSACVAQQLLHDRAFPGKLRRVLHMLQLAAAANAEDRAACLASLRCSLVYLRNPYARRAWHASLPAAIALSRAPFPSPCWRFDCNRHPFSRQSGGNAQYLPLLSPITIKHSNVSRCVPLARQFAQGHRIICDTPFFYHRFLNFFILL